MKTQIIPIPRQQCQMPGFTYVLAPRLKTRKPFKVSVLVITAFGFYLGYLLSQLTSTPMLERKVLNSYFSVQENLTSDSNVKRSIQRYQTLSLYLNNQNQETSSPGKPESARTK